LLRTNLGRAAQLRREILQAHTSGLPIAGASWRDVPLVEEENGWSLEMPLLEPGFFKAKPYLLDSKGWQHWPEGQDVGISVHPDTYRTANTLYCAFPRLFGQTQSAKSAENETLKPTLAPFDDQGYTVIPPSGKLRDLTKQLPHIFGVLGCRILHLLPVNPTPTTYARFGRFGSPYAALDLTAIDPALVVFDKRTTGIDQFRELTYAAHSHGGRVFLDMVINHTGWGSVLQENHPEWFLRNSQGSFVSPGAWRVTWEDLVEVGHRDVQLWDELGDAFLTWCRRGVDGFRCDAGYKVPVAAWQYIIARVQQEYPETLFFLEGLGGAWEVTEALLTDGGMQWAYSELFQNYSGLQVAGYLDHSLKQSNRVGLLIHYSETHDNERLAARGRSWSLLRNRLCGLTSNSGGFGFTCGVEWLATEKIDVHDSSRLAWDNPKNLLPELARLNQILADHPCFFDGATLTRLSPVDSPVYALLRDSSEGADRVLVLINTDDEKPRELVLDLATQGLAPADAREPASPKSDGRAGPLPDVSKWRDLLGQTGPTFERAPDRSILARLPAGAAFCLSPSLSPTGLRGEPYRRARSQAAWGLAAFGHSLPPEQIGRADWRALAAEVERSPRQFLASAAQLKSAGSQADHPFPFRRAEGRGEGSAPSLSLMEILRQLREGSPFPAVVTWSLLDRRRVTPVPPGHWLLVQDQARFRASLTVQNDQAVRNVASISVGDGHVACFPPRSAAANAILLLERYAEADQQVQARLRYLDPDPASAKFQPQSTDLVLLTNGRGGMARICVDLGRILSKYDCVLGANLHPTLPVDCHVLAKRIRVWVNAHGFISPLDFRSLESFIPGPPAVWNLVANAGDGRTVEIQMSSSMLEGRNTTAFRFSRPTAAQASGKQLPSEADVRLTVRIDLEDRGFHSETRRNGGAEYHFSTHTHPVPASAIRAQGQVDEEAAGNPPDAGRFAGFRFTPAPDRCLYVVANAGTYHPQPEWSENIPHPVEQSRGQVGSGDAFSPGWFEIPLPKGSEVILLVSAEPWESVEAELQKASGVLQPLLVPNPPTPGDAFQNRLVRAVRAFVVQRDSGKTVIAGYPWFLDWGRDTFICARGLFAAGLVEEVKQIVLTFARFEKDGTLPNTIFGEDASNRDTSDAPLWFGVVCEELAARTGPVANLAVAARRTLLDVLRSIASGYIKGTPNGIRMDAASGLIWSPAHFTWMDTNYPLGTPREGYPIEIQALWIRLLQNLQAIDAPGARPQWQALAQRARASLEKLFWLEDRGYYADVLFAKHEQAAAGATADDALRSNCLLVVSLGLAESTRARRCVDAALRYLVVPGALRSLAPLPVSVPLPIYAPDGRLLNNPREPYWGRYEGDEDTRRKPAYHNGTAWTWTFPVFSEALARAWNFSPAAVATARAYLGSMEELLDEGCLGQIPEILDGDAPHTQRGCDAQAWGATEALRVWTLLRSDERKA
jgi:predicted glycogen debranching enzyme